MNRTTIILSVSAIALLATSPLALAREPLKASTSVSGRDLLFKKPDLNLQKPTNPNGNGTTNAVKTGTNGGLSGLGVPGGLNTGTGFKGPNGNSVMPKGAADTVKDGVSGLKLGAGQAKGVEAKGNISDRLAPGMIGAIRADRATKGKELGVQQGDGISAKYAPGMIKAIHDDNATKGKEKGVQSGEGSYRLTPGQLQQMKDMTVNPKINPTIGSLDQLKFDPKDDKGGTGKKPAPMPAGPKPTGDKTPAPKPSGTVTPKPATPKPTGGTTAGTKTPKPAGSGGKVAGVNPKTGTGTPAPKPKVSQGGKLIEFPAVRITPKPKPGPLDKTFPKPKEPPKLDVIGSPAMDRLQ